MIPITRIFETNLENEIAVLIEIIEEKFSEKKYFYHRFDGVMWAMQKEAIRKSSSEWRKEDGKKLTWNTENLWKIISAIFEKVELKEYDEYQTPMPKYQFSCKNDLAGRYSDLYSYFRVLKDRESVLLETVPLLLLCEFINAYHEAFPEDFPLVLGDSQFGNIARIMEGTTVEDIFDALALEDPEDSWKAVE